MLNSIIKFYRIYSAAIPPMRADASALGTLPAAAYQYCQAVRTASGFGWYIFPPVDIRLKWDGVDTFHEIDGEWRLLASEHLGDGFLNEWNAHAPADLNGRAPSYLSSLFVPGVVQIWSGMFVSSAPDWSVLIRPPVNVANSCAFACYEGLIEADQFGPCPLFVNIRLIATGQEIVIPKLKPLFQVQPIKRECYADTTLRYDEFDAIAQQPGKPFGMSMADWEGFRGTIRSADPADNDHETGSYGANVRRRAKRELQALGQGEPTCPMKVGKQAPEDVVGM
jgi:hypothetical protein